MSSKQFLGIINSLSAAVYKMGNNPCANGNSSSTRARRIDRSRDALATDLCPTFRSSTNMTAPRGSWFGQGPLHEVYHVGGVVKLDNPQYTEWEIDEILKEDIHEMEPDDIDDDVQSLAALKVLCYKVGSKKTRAMMRIYFQIPWTNTDNEPTGVRAAQAATFKPKELLAHQILSNHPRASLCTPRLLGFQEFKQQGYSAVPGGFETIVVWQVVRGLRLGDHSGPVDFWSLESAERELIRDEFRKTLECVRASLLTRIIVR